MTERRQLGRPRDRLGLPRSRKFRRLETECSHNERNLTVFALINVNLSGIKTIRALCPTCGRLGMFLVPADYKLPEGIKVS